MSAETLHDEEAKQPNDEQQANLDLLTSSISVCITTGNTTMDEKVTEAARNYYLSIVNNDQLSTQQKRYKIYEDLALRTKSFLNMDTKEDTEHNKLSLSYRVGLDSDTISTVDGLIICVGHYEENDICIESEFVSRIHCFIFQVNDTLIVLDGWSKCGTKTINVASNHMYKDDDSECDTKEHEYDQKLISSLPKQRNILQFNVNDTIHLIIGDDKYGTHLIINPKPCIVCVVNARTMRLKCGHQVLCKQCFIKIQKNMHSVCPICRKYTKEPKISAGIHTFACSIDSDSNQ